MGDLYFLGFFREFMFIYVVKYYKKLINDLSINQSSRSITSTDLTSSDWLTCSVCGFASVPWFTEGCSGLGF
jgi:hypothetical protein